MWKKALWMYLGLYVLGVLGVTVYVSIRDLNAGNFDLGSLIFLLVMLVPAGLVALELRGKKVFILFILFAILLEALPVVAIFNFNEMSLATIGKALLFLPMIAGLIYFGFKRLFKK